MARTFRPGVKDLVGSCRLCRLAAGVAAHELSSAAARSLVRAGVERGVAAAPATAPATVKVQTMILNSNLFQNSWISFVHITTVGLLKSTLKSLSIDSIARLLSLPWLILDL